MSSLSELSLLTARPAAPAGPGYQTAKAGAVAAQPQSVATAPAQNESSAARTQAPEPTRSQSAEHRLRQNRPEEGPTPSETSSPDVELRFGDFIDLINPLHHIPIVGTIYRAITQHSVPSFATTDRGFAQRMLEALDKYEAQATERFRNISRADRRLDLNL